MKPTGLITTCSCLACLSLTVECGSLGSFRSLNPRFCPRCGHRVEQFSEMLVSSLPPTAPGIAYLRSTGILRKCLQSSEGGIWSDTRPWPTMELFASESQSLHG